MTMTITTREKISSSFPNALTFKCNVTAIALLAALLLTTVYNLTFWHQLLSLPDISVSCNAGFLLGSSIVLTGIFFRIFYPLQLSLHLQNSSH